MVYPIRVIKRIVLIVILIASSSLLAISCENQQDEWPISHDKCVFIDHHINTYGECIEGECQKLCIDFGTYDFNEAENTLYFFTDFKVNRALKIVYGSGESLSGDAGMGAATGLTPIYELPYKQSDFRLSYELGDFEILNIEPDGTCHIKYNEISIILKSGEKWSNITTRVDTQECRDGPCKLKQTITDTIVNYGILDKSKIKNK